MFAKGPHLTKQTEAKTGAPKLFCARVLVELNLVYEATSEARHILKDS